MDAESRIGRAELSGSRNRWGVSAFSQPQGTAEKNQWGCNQDTCVESCVRWYARFGMRLAASPSETRRGERRVHRGGTVWR